MQRLDSIVQNHKLYFPRNEHYDIMDYDSKQFAYIERKYVEL